MRGRVVTRSYITHAHQLLHKSWISPVSLALSPILPRQLASSAPPPLLPGSRVPTPFTFTMRVLLTAQSSPIARLTGRWLAASCVLGPGRTWRCAPPLPLPGPSRRTWLPRGRAQTPPEGNGWIPQCHGHTKACFLSSSPRHEDYARLFTHAGPGRERPQKEAVRPLGRRSNTGPWSPVARREEACVHVATVISSSDMRLPPSCTGRAATTIRVTVGRQGPRWVGYLVLSAMRDHDGSARDLLGLADTAYE